MYVVYEACGDQFMRRICKLILTVIFHFLQVSRREYRGQRSVDAFSNYVREQMKSKINEFHALSDLHVDVSIFILKLIIHVKNQKADSV